MSSFSDDRQSVDDLIFIHFLYPPEKIFLKKRDSPYVRRTSFGVGAPYRDCPGTTHLLRCLMWTWTVAPSSGSRMEVSMFASTVSTDTSKPGVTKLHSSGNGTIPPSLPNIHTGRTYIQIIVDENYKL